MIVAVNTIRIRSGYLDEVAERFKNPKGVHRMPGFVRMELWGQRGDVYDELMVCTAWDSREAFEAWVNGEEFRKAHGRSGRAEGGSETGAAMLDSRLTVHEVLYSYPGKEQEV